MNSIHRSILACALMAGGASLVLMFGTPGVRAEIVTAQGADGANGVGDDPYAVPEEGELVTATAGSIQPVSDPSNSAFATGGNGGNGGNVPGNGTGAPGGAARAMAATAVNSGSAEADATAIGGNGGNIGGNNQNDGYGSSASANSTAVTNGSGDASSSANATGGATGFGDFGFAGSAFAVADAAAAGGGKAAAAAFATGGICNTVCVPFNGANATSNAETVKGAMADAQSIAISGELPDNYENAPGVASSTAKTSFASVSVQSSALAKPGVVNSEGGGASGGVAATTDAIAQGGSGQAFANPGETAYAFSTALPDKAYATSLIDGAGNVSSALLEPRDLLFGTAISAPITLRAAQARAAVIAQARPSISAIGAICWLA